MAKLHEKYYKHRDLIKELLSDYEINNAEDLSNALKDVLPEPYRICWRPN